MNPSPSDPKQETSQTWRCWPRGARDPAKENALLVHIYLLFVRLLRLKTAVVECYYFPSARRLFEDSGARKTPGRFVKIRSRHRSFQSARFIETDPRERLNVHIPIDTNSSPFIWLLFGLHWFPMRSLINRRARHQFSFKNWIRFSIARSSRVFHKSTAKMYPERVFMPGAFTAIYKWFTERCGFRHNWKADRCKISQIFSKRV